MMAAGYGGYGEANNVPSPAGRIHSKQSKPLASENQPPFSDPNRWKLGRVIGAGPFGTVREVTDSAGQLTNIVDKEIRAHFLSSTNASGIIPASRLRDAELSVKGIKHPHIITIHGAYQRPDPNSPQDIEEHVVMERLSGETLREYIQRQTTTEEQALQLLRQISAGDTYVFTERDIIHRDLRPVNIMRTPERGPVLFDFGIAAKPGEAMGTAMTRIGDDDRFLAPNARDGLHTFSDDNYALAQIAAALRGNRPNGHELSTQDFHYNNQALRAFLAKNASYDPNKRSTNPLEFARELERIIGGDAISVSAPTARRVEPLTTNGETYLAKFHAKPLTGTPEPLVAIDRSKLPEDLQRRNLKIEHYALHNVNEDARRIVEALRLSRQTKFGAEFDKNDPEFAAANRLFAAFGERMGMMTYGSREDDGTMSHKTVFKNTKMSVGEFLQKAAMLENTIEKARVKHPGITLLPEHLQKNLELIVPYHMTGRRIEDDVRALYNNKLAFWKDVNEYRKTVRAVMNVMPSIPTRRGTERGPDIPLSILLEHKDKHKEGLLAYARSLDQQLIEAGVTSRDSEVLRAHGVTYKTQWQQTQARKLGVFEGKYAKDAWELEKKQLFEVIGYERDVKNLKSKGALATLLTGATYYFGSLEPTEFASFLGLGAFATLFSIARDIVIHEPNKIWECINQTDKFYEETSMTKRPKGRFTM